MLPAFAFNSAFLISYIASRTLDGDSIFPGRGPVRTLKSHVTKDCYIEAFARGVMAAMKKLDATANLVKQSAPQPYNRPNL